MVIYSNKLFTHFILLTFEHLGAYFHEVPIVFQTDWLLVYYYCTENIIVSLTFINCRFGHLHLGEIFDAILIKRLFKKIKN